MPCIRAARSARACTTPPRARRLRRRLRRDPDRRAQSHAIVDQALTALRNLEHRGASGAEPDTGDGAGILLQVPDEFLRAVVDFALPARRRVRRRHRVPAGRRRRGAAPQARSRRSPPGGPARPRLARRAHRPGRWSAPPPGRCMPRFRQLFVAADRPARPVGLALERLRVLPAQARRARGRRLLPVAVGAHHRLQGHAHHRAARAVLPRPVRPRGSPARSPWCTRGSRPTRSRAGRWPTRTATSPTTARSTPSRATATGCGRARRSWPAT